MIVQKAIIYGVAIAGALAFDYIQRKKAEKILAELENTQKNNSTSEAADKARENFAAKTKPTEKSNSLPKEDTKAGESSISQEHKKPKSGQGKENADDVPSWAEGEAPYKGESGKDFSKRLMDDKYGKNNYDTGPGSEYNKLKKWGDRGFE